uniref:HlyD family efflux transporter periplasmic adaptor subunit n=1 Tax=Acetatifactor sp. TaxID=1872090 RepID=UPI004056C417
MARTKAKKKIRKYRKPLNLNIGMLIFGVIFIYVIIMVVMYFQTTHIVRYEVKEGSLATNNIFRGIIIRDETVVNAEAAGYVNYYACEGERVAKNDLVYIIDESGRLNEYLEDANLGENSLSEKELSEFRSDIANFQHGFDERSYENVYDFKSTLNNTVSKLANANMLQRIEDMNGGASLSGVVSYCNAPLTGIVAFWVDGYESLTPEMVTSDIFENEKEGEYKKTQMLGNSLMTSGDPVYKVSDNENWSIVVPIDSERGAQMEAEEYVKVRFLKNQYESWGEVKLLHNADGNTYLQLSFTNSMITFINDRFLDIELIIHDEEGLKIPNSAIVEKEFYLIPEDYVTTGGEDGLEGVIRQCFLEDGTMSTEFIVTDLYSYDETTKEYYLDTDILGAGDVLYKTDSQETYTVSRRATLIGVYNMNKGYADFKQINILYQNEEYAIVKANTQYGLNVYDYIVLDASAVSDDQFIND